VGSLIGLAGLALTWWFHRWSRNPARPDRARSVDDALTGRSLLSAQKVLDELSAFESE